MDPWTKRVAWHAIHSKRGASSEHPCQALTTGPTACSRRPTIPSLRGRHKRLDSVTICSKLKTIARDGFPQCLHTPQGGRDKRKVVRHLLQAKYECADHLGQQGGRPSPIPLCSFNSIQLTLCTSQDWFYVCPSHLKDPGFCTPKIDQAAIEARKKRELKEEIERVKKEYEEKQKKKKEKKEKAADDEKKDEAAAKKDMDDKTAEDAEKTEPKNEPAVGGVRNTRLLWALSVSADNTFCRGLETQTRRLSMKRNRASLSSKGSNPPGPVPLPPPC